MRAAIGDGFRRDGAKHEAWIAPVLRYGHDRLAFGLHLDGMIKRSDTHVGAAANQRLEGTGAALHISDFDLETCVPEISEALGDRERQIEDRRFATDRQPHPGRFRLVLCTCRRVQDQRKSGSGAQQDGPHGFLLTQGADLSITADGPGAELEATTTRLGTGTPCSSRVTVCFRHTRLRSASAIAWRTCAGP